MIIKYQFANGEVSEIEVDEKFNSLLIELDRKEYNINHKETRRHTSLANCNEDGQWLSTFDKDLSMLFEDESNEDKLQKAIEHLLPQQKELLKAIYYEGTSVNDYAKKEKVHQSAISHRLERIYKQIKKYF